MTDQQPPIPNPNRITQKHAPSARPPGKRSTFRTVMIMLSVALVFGASGIYTGIMRHGPVDDPANQGTTQQNPVQATATPASPVEKLYAISMDDIAGKPQALAAWRGKNVVVNFWATWCAPCVDEMPELSALQKELAPTGVQIIGLGVDTADNMRTFAGKYKIAYPLYVAGIGGAELSRGFGNQTGGLPFTVIIGADGSIKKTYLGRLTMENLRRDLAAL